MRRIVSDAISTNRGSAFGSLTNRASSGSSSICLLTAINSSSLVDSGTPGGGPVKRPVRSKMASTMIVAPAAER